MRKLLLPVLLAISAVTPWSQSVTAGVSGPYVDFRSEFDPNAIHIVIPTSYTGADGKKQSDSVTITIDFWERLTIPLGGFAWEQIDAAADAMRITTMYGLDVAPGESSLRLTGFTSEEALGVRFSDEHFFGRSGAAYLGESLGTLSLGELPVMFPDFDLSPFQGDSSSLVYVFQTTMPLADVPVPEPSAWVLAVGGVLVLAAARRRRRARAGCAAACEHAVPPHA